ncbi:MAG: hypothetical protein M3198_06085 [Actinomycetota bacterium]|nr:hypothetical protein [Actinomycetota bacterium]
MGDISRKEDDMERPFAGGIVSIRNHPGPSPDGPGTPTTVQVRFLGFHCIEESNEWSASDEPYFLISVVSTHRSVTKKFGPFENVDAGENHPMVAGVAAFEDDVIPPVILGVIANEHDEGTPEEAAEKAREVARALMEKMEEAAASFGAATAGSHVIPEWLRDIWIGWIPEGAAAVLGLGDDHVGSNGRILFDYDPQLKQWKTPPSIGTFEDNPYNVKLKVGVNPEEGKYELYFDVKVQNAGHV